MRVQCRSIATGLCERGPMHEPASPPADSGEHGPASSSHGHAHLEPPAVHPHAGRFLWSGIVVCGVVVALAAIVLWPSDDPAVSDPLLLQADTISAEVVAVELRPCSASLIDRCRWIEFEMANGPFAGQIASFEEATTDGILDPGDGILVVWFEDISGEPVFAFYDFQRDGPMIWLLAVFVLAVVAVGRWRGLGALGGWRVDWSSRCMSR